MQPEHKMPQVQGVDESQSVQHVGLKWEEWQRRGPEQVREPSDVDGEGEESPWWYPCPWEAQRVEGEW